MRGIQLSRRADVHRRQFAADNADSNDPGHETRQMARRIAPVSSSVAIVRALEISVTETLVDSLCEANSHFFFPFGYASDID